MPNWCDNVLYIEAPKEDIAAIKAAIEKQDSNKQGLLNYLCPEPEHTEIEESGVMPAWRNWRIQNWGTKWEVDAEIVSETETSLYMHFDSAWSPPIEALQYWLIQNDARIVELLYIEWGMAFCGVFNNHEDSYYKIPATAAEVAENIPEELDMQFDIEETVAQWEEELEEA